MKKRILSLLLVSVLLLAVLPGMAQAANAEDYPIVFTTFNASGVENNPEYYPDFTVGGSDLLVQAVTTYHYNHGSGKTPGTISIYDWDDNLVGSWNAVGRGASNRYWDVFPNIVLRAGQRYYIADSDPETWSHNSASDNTGFAEVRGKYGAGVTPAQQAITVTVNSNPVKWTDVQPFINADSRTMVPLRAVAEALGLEVSWDGNAREAVFSSGSKTIYFPIDSTRYRTESGSYGTMDTAAVIVNSRTFAPIRYLAEYFGYAVGWDGATRTVSISGSSDPGPVSHGYVWVLKDTEYKLNDTDNEYSTIDYTYLGVVDGMVTFKRTGGYNHNGKYALCDGTYSCQEAPGTIPAGDTVGLKMRLLIENYAWKDDPDYVRNAVHIGELYIRIDTYRSFENSEGESHLKVGTDAGGPYTNRNVDLSDTYYYTTPDSDSVGSKMEFGFHCEAGTYTWYYELEAN